VLHRSLRASHPLMTRSLAEVRLTQGIQNRAQFVVAGVIAEIASASTLDANARGVRLTVTPVEDGVAIEADRQVLACGLPSGVTSRGNVGDVGPGSVATQYLRSSANA
jgi:hypothetical protein